MVLSGGYGLCAGKTGIPVFYLNDTHGIFILTKAQLAGAVVTRAPEGAVLFDNEYIGNPCVNVPDPH
jgi:hypothetical protein